MRKFENTEKKMDQVIKQSFMYNFLEWVEWYIGNCSLSMLYFIINDKTSLIT